MTITGEVPFSVRLPPNWFPIDLWTEHLDGLVDQRLASDTRLAEHGDPLRQFVHAIADGAQRRGVVLAAGMAEPLDGGQLLTATATAVMTTGPGADVDVIAGQVSSAERDDRSGRDWRRVEVREIPAGRCVRVTGVESLASSGVRGVVMHSLVPVPDAGSGPNVLDLVLISPAAGLAEPLLDLFDAISGTLTWGTASAGPA